MLFSACKKNSAGVNQPNNQKLNDTLSDATELLLANLPDTAIMLDSVLLDDGENVESFLQTYDPNFLQTYPSEAVTKHHSGSTSVNGLNGTGPSTSGLDGPTQRRLFISRMIASGAYLITKSNWIFPADPTSASGITIVRPEWISL